MSNMCRVCKKEYTRKTNEESCKECRDFDKLASAVFQNEKRLKKVNLKEFPDIPALANYVKDLFNEQEGKCFYTDYEMNLPYSNPDATGSGTMCSIDRKDPRKEYSKNNIVLALSRINIMKNDIESEGDFYEICKKIKDHYEERNNHLIDINKLSDEELLELKKRIIHERGETK